MPYVKKNIGFANNIKAYKFLINYGFDLKKSQQVIDKKRLFCGSNEVIRKNEILNGFVFLIDYHCQPTGLKPIYENDDFAIFDKPSGVLSHPNGRGCSYSLYDEIWHMYGSNSGVVHRLDKETSGLIIVAKNKETLSLLKQSFQSQIVKKGYIALVSGIITDSILCDNFIKKTESKQDISTKMEIYDTQILNSKKAITYFKPIENFNNMTLIRCEPKTGRQHQIRAQLFHLGHGIVGDPIYGVDYNTSDKIITGNITRLERINLIKSDRLCLHALDIEFIFKNKIFNFSSNVDVKNIFLNSLIS